MKLKTFQPKLLNNKIYGNYINMESGRMMLLHSIIIGLFYTLL